MGQPKQEDSDYLLWLHRNYDDDLGPSLLAVASLINFTEPLAAFKNLYPSYKKSVLPQLLKERTEAALAGLGNPWEFHDRYDVLAGREADALRRKPSLSLNLLVQAPPAPTRKKALEIRFTGFDEQSRFWRLALQFSQRWLQGSRNGRQALGILVAITADRSTFYRAKDGLVAFDQNSILNALSHGDRQAKADTRLARQAVTSARKMLKRQGYSKRKLIYQSRDAEIWATVWVKYGGSLDDALKGEYSNWLKPNLSSAIAPFNKALGMKLQRGRRRSTGNEEGPLELDYGIRPPAKPVTLRSRDTRYDPPLPATIPLPTDSCPKCEGALGYEEDQDGRYTRCQNCAKYWHGWPDPPERLRV